MILRVLDPRHLLQPLFGRVGVEGEHQGARAGAEGLGQLGVGDVLLAFDGDAVDAESGSDGESLGAAFRLAVEAVLSAHPKSVSCGAGEQEHGDDRQTPLPR
jgi:hypothetical protein